MTAGYNVRLRSGEIVHYPDYTREAPRFSYTGEQLLSYSHRIEVDSGSLLVWRGQLGVQHAKLRSASDAKESTNWVELTVRHIYAPGEWLEAWLVEAEE